MQTGPSIHDAYGGFGDKSSTKLNTTNQNIIQNNQSPQQSTPSITTAKPLPNDASYSNFPTHIKCPKCNNICVTRIQSELGTAAWLWCVLLAPFACIGLGCLCIQSCKDKIHYCTRCGHIVGKKFAKAC